MKAPCPHRRAIGRSINGSGVVKNTLFGSFTFCRRDNGDEGGNRLITAVAVGWMLPLPFLPPAPPPPTALPPEVVLAFGMIFTEFVKRDNSLLVFDSEGDETQHDRTKDIISSTE